MTKNLEPTQELYLNSYSDAMNRARDKLEPTQELYLNPNSVWLGS